MPVVSKVKIPGSTIPVDIRNGYYANLYLQDNLWVVDDSNLPYEPFIGMKLSLYLSGPLYSNSEVNPPITLIFGNNDQYEIDNINYIIKDNSVRINICANILDIHDHVLSILFNDIIEGNAEYNMNTLSADIDENDDSLLILSENHYASKYLDVVASLYDSHVIIHKYGRAISGWEAL